MSHRIWRRAMAHFLIILFGSFSLANTQHIKPEEFVFLPDVCRYTWDGPYRHLYDAGIGHFSKYKDHPEYYKLYYYYSLFGPELIHMHHYCRGLVQLREVRSCKDEQCRNWKMQRAVAEFDYVLNHTGSDFLMKPEILVNRGQILLLLKKNIEGASSIRQAIELRPDYILAYLLLSSHLAMQGMVSQARFVLESGLRYAPENIDLKNRLRELEGLRDGSTEESKGKK